MAKKPATTPDALCLAAIDAALKRYGCVLVAVPAYAQDGRGGWTLTTTIRVVKS